MPVTFCGKPESCGVSNGSRDEQSRSISHVFRGYRHGEQVCVDRRTGNPQPEPVIRHGPTPRGRAEKVNSVLHGQLDKREKGMARRARPMAGANGARKRGGKRGSGEGMEKRNMGVAPDLQWDDLLPQLDSSVGLVEQGLPSRLAPRLS